MKLTDESSVGFLIEIDHHIPTKNQIELRKACRRRGKRMLNQIVVPKRHALAKLGANQPVLARTQKASRAQRFRRGAQGPVAEHTLAGLGDKRPVDVGSHDRHIPVGKNVAPVLPQQDRDGIRLGTVAQPALQMRSRRDARLRSINSGSTPSRRQLNCSS